MQVKTETSQRELDEYMAALEGRPEGRMFYAFHTAKGAITDGTGAVILIGPERLAEMVLEAGLFDWLIRPLS